MTKALNLGVAALMLCAAAPRYATSARAADDDPKPAILAATAKLAAQPSWAWRRATTTQGWGGPAANASSSGRVDSRGQFWAKLPLERGRAGGTVELAARGEHRAVLLGGDWMTLEQAQSRLREGGGSAGESSAIAAALSRFEPPLREVEDLVGRCERFERSADGWIGALGPGAASELFAAVPGSGRRRPGAIANPAGSVAVAIADGMVVRLELTLTGTRERTGEDSKVERKTVIELDGIGSSAADLPADAEEIVGALAAGRTPRVFVPEPGFRKLFDGRSLDGWAGRPEHWSVEDGAITGRSTSAVPARGNTFLIARPGGKDLVADDFELRFAYKIRADNDSGFANSGMQYRSKALADFVVAGYQADFEAGSTYSGILYDEGGGAGGRGILAQRGESVVWSASGERRVTGRTGDPDAIQAAIRKDDWNDYTIIARGSRLQHFINGKQTVDVTDDAPSRLASGIIALQLHAGEPMTVQMKDVRIRSLSAPDVSGGSNLGVAKGFKLELLYTVPRESQGSWVALCVDPKGRLITSDQTGKLYRITLPPPGEGGEIEPEPIDLEIGGAHGLLHAFGSLYVMVNERNPRGLYRLRDTDGDDRFDRVELLREIRGGGEHGPHSLVLSPDGKSIYVVCGNSTTLTDIDSSRAPLHWSEDELLPRLPTGFMDESLAPQGWIARTDPDGKSWELIAMGLRNEFDAAFNRDGELFTYDADMEWDIGDPWYRPTRVNHVISGAEFGFRNGDAKWPDYYLDSFGSVVDCGPGSPTGIAFGHGARFPAKYQDALYIADWSFGKLRAVHLTPDGASYRGETEEFVWGQPFPVTDVVIHPLDGAMYLTVGGRRTQSALYRVTYVGTESTAPSAPDVRFAEQRALRASLERYHGLADPAAVATVWPHLRSADRAIRHAARVALEWQDVASWRDAALDEKDARTAIAAIVALARVTRKDAAHRRDGDPAPDPALGSRMLAALDRIEWSGLARGDRIDLLRAYSLVFIRLGPLGEPERERARARLEPLFPANAREIDALLARLLVHLQAPSAAEKIVAALRSAPTQEEQIDYALALRSLEAGWTPALAEEYFRWFLEAASFRGGNTFASSLRRIKEEALARSSAEEKAALKPVLEAPVEQRSPRELLAARGIVKAWTLGELLPIVERGLQETRSLERGRKLYGEVACSACHRFDQEGGSVGPDLTGAAGRFNIRDLLESIVEPSKTISDQYQAIVIAKKNGDIVTGRVANLSSNDLNIVEDMFNPGAMTNVRRSDIEVMEPSTVSMMPEGLLDSLHEDEIQDLVAYLLSRGGSRGPVTD